jgi:hypothetical protein
MCIRTVCICVSAMLGDSSLRLGFLVRGAEPRVNYGCSVGVGNALYVQSCLPASAGERVSILSPAWVLGTRAAVIFSLRASLRL